MNTKSVELTNKDRVLDSINTLVASSIEDAQAVFDSMKKGSLLDFINDSLYLRCKSFQCTQLRVNKKGETTGRAPAVMTQDELLAKLSASLNEVRGETDSLTVAQKRVDQARKAQAECLQALYKVIPADRLKAMTLTARMEIAEYQAFDNARTALKSAIAQLESLTAELEASAEDI